MKFLKTNWKLLLVYGALFIALIVSSALLISKCINDNKENGTVIIDSETLIEMIEDKEDFVITIGQYSCHACKQFDATLREYTKDHKVYYFYADNENDLMLYDALSLIKSKLKEIPSNRNIKALYTPTTIYVEKGIFKDGYQGHIDVDDEGYQEFKNIIEGKFVKREKVVVDINTLLTKIISGDEFVFTIGQNGCSSCQKFDLVIDKYVKEGYVLHYIYANADNVDALLELYAKANNEVPDDRGEMMYAPTTFYVKGGVMLDAYVGDFEVDDRETYDLFVKIMNGEYVNKEYPIK